LSPTARGINSHHSQQSQPHQRMHAVTTTSSTLSSSSFGERVSAEAAVGFVVLPGTASSKPPASNPRAPCTLTLTFTLTPTLPFIAARLHCVAAHREAARGYRRASTPGVGADRARCVPRVERVLVTRWLRQRPHSRWDAVATFPTLTAAWFVLELVQRLDVVRFGGRVGFASLALLTPKGASKECRADR